MEEFLDILNENWNKTGKSLSKKEIHQLWLRHAATHIRIYNSKWEVLLQKRSLQKSSHPWERDISAAWHISSWEDMITWALRELEEELWIKTDSINLKEICKRKNSSEYNKEYNIIYLYKYDGKINDLRMQPEEVDELKFISLKEFKVNSQNPSKNNYVEHRPEYFTIVIEALENILHN